MTKHDEASIFADAAAAGLRRSRDGQRKMRKPIPVVKLPTFGSLGDIAQIKPLLADSKPLQQRLRVLWAAAKQARHLGSRDEVFNAFRALAIEVKLINSQGWCAAGVRDSERRFGPEDMAHIVKWALRGKNPFDGETDDAGQQQEARDVDQK